MYTNIELEMLHNSLYHPQTDRIFTLPKCEKYHFQLYKTKKARENISNI